MCMFVISPSSVLPAMACCTAPEQREVQTHKLTFDCLAMTKYLGNASRGSVCVCVWCAEEVVMMSLQAPQRLIFIQETVHLPVQTACYREMNLTVCVCVRVSPGGALSR